MIYFYWYLGVGTAVVTIMLAYARLARKDDDCSATSPALIERKSLERRFLNEAAILTTAVLFWPLVALLPVLDRHYRAESEDRNREFAVTRKDLQAALSIQEIEAREMVFDPLGAVPNVPFGHLNAEWVRFIEGVRTEDRLWSFSSHWTKCGHKRLLQGYVIVRGEEIGDYCLTVMKYIEDEASSGKVGRDRKIRTDLPAWLRRQAD